MPTPYTFASMTLGDIVRVLMDHQLTFEDVRGMTPPDLHAALDRVNRGEIKSWKEIEAEEKAKRSKK